MMVKNSNYCLVTWFPSPSDSPEERSWANKTSNVQSPKHLPVFQDKVVSDTVSLVFSPLLLLFPSPKISPLRSHHLFQKTDEQKMENVFQLHYI